MTYYNDGDPHAAQWLRNLIRDGLISRGEVDERPIELVRPDDIRGYTRCHWFAGIGGWDLALSLAGWPKERPVWTGSCPCQPFSEAGRKKKMDDPRHVWPCWRELILQLRPATIFGEQLSTPGGLEWFDAVADDLESEGYAVAAADLGAACVGAPQQRQRLWFVASLEYEPAGVAAGSLADDLLPRDEKRFEPEQNIAKEVRSRPEPETPWSSPVWVRCGDHLYRPVPTSGAECEVLRMADGLPGDLGRCSADRETFPTTEMGTVPGRKRMIRGLGNAIVPQVAAVFIKACMECIPNRKA